MAKISTSQDYIDYERACYNRCMINNMEHKVVKCTNSKCGLYFGHTEKSTKCPFCKTEYGEKRVEEKPKEKKLTIKTQKDSFKIWKDI